MDVVPGMPPRRPFGWVKGAVTVVLGVVAAHIVLSVGTLFLAPFIIGLAMQSANDEADSAPYVDTESGVPYDSGLPNLSPSATSSPGSPTRDQVPDADPTPPDGLARRTPAGAVVLPPRSPQQPVVDPEALIPTTSLDALAYARKIVPTNLMKGATCVQEKGGRCVVVAFARDVYGVPEDRVRETVVKARAFGSSLIQFEVRENAEVVVAVVRHDPYMVFVTAQVAGIPARTVLSVTVAQKGVERPPGDTQQLPAVLK